MYINSFNLAKAYKVIIIPDLWRTNLRNKGVKLFLTLHRNCQNLNLGTLALNNIHGHLSLFN